MRYPQPAYWRCKIISVHDGDTLTVTVDRGFDDASTMSIRLYTTFAPELTQPGGKETRDFVLGWLQDHDDGSAWPFLLQTYRTPKSDTEVMTFTRYVGTLLDITGADLNTAVEQFVTDHGYSGGTGA